MVSDKYYILYTVVPITGDYFKIFFSKVRWAVKLKSEIPHTYKYKVSIPPNAATQVIKPSNIDYYDPYLIICSCYTDGHATSSTFVKGETKYIYNSRYPITTTKQPYRQLKEHIAQYLIDKLIKSL